MASSPNASESSPIWSGRITEWSIVAVVLVVLMWVFEHETRVVKGQSEKIMVWSTLATLRAAIGIDLLTRQVRPASSGLVERSPFRLLERRPASFAGDVAQRDMYLTPPGSWVFDPECGCIGYRMLYPQWLEPPQDADAIWFRIETKNGEVHLLPTSRYRWFGQSLN